MDLKITLTQLKSQSSHSAVRFTGPNPGLSNFWEYLLWQLNGKKASLIQWLRGIHSLADSLSPGPTGLAPLLGAVKNG